MQEKASGPGVREGSPEIDRYGGAVWLEWGRKRVRMVLAMG